MRMCVYRTSTLRVQSVRVVSMRYKLFFRWVRNVDEFENDCVEKPRLLRVDHIGPIVRLYDFCYEKYYRAHHEGTKEIRN